MVTMHIILYILGCILSYGRVNASFYEIEEENNFMCTEAKNSIWKYEVKAPIIMVLLSWIGAFSGFIIYFLQKEKYFLRFKNWDK